MCVRSVRGGARGGVRGGVRGGLHRGLHRGARVVRGVRGGVRGGAWWHACWYVCVLSPRFTLGPPFSSCRGHSARFPSRANEATEIGWVRRWTQHLAPV